jgi:hypothetical protein
MPNGRSLRPYMNLKVEKRSVPSFFWESSLLADFADVLALFLDMQRTTSASSQSSVLILPRRYFIFLATTMSGEMTSQTRS